MGASLLAKAASQPLHNLLLHTQHPANKIPYKKHLNNREAQQNLAFQPWHACCSTTPISANVPRTRQ
ncbi:hypothetical protein EMIT0P265_10436 [Pseudomonas zeae]